MKHVWTVICEKSITDSETNTITLINIIEQIQRAEREEIQREEFVRGMFVRMEVVSMWCRSDPDRPESGNSKTTLLSPSGDVLAESEASVDLAEYQRLRSRWMLPGIPYAGDGRYTFAVQHEINGEWQTVATVPIEIASISL